MVRIQTASIPQKYRNKLSRKPPRPVGTHTKIDKQTFVFPS
ncbi:hypothetical protein [Leptospira gomenensis]|nr:hypothetical protein [Leptospira gomenensis]